MSIINLTVSHPMLPHNCPDCSVVAASSPSSGLIVGQTAAAFVTRKQLACLLGDMTQCDTHARTRAVAPPAVM